MRFRGVMFDFDGTLADTLPVIFEAFRQALSEFSTETYTDLDIMGLFGPSEDGCIRKVLPDRWEECYDRYLDEYERLHDLCPDVFPGIRRALAEMRERGIRLALVTGKGEGSASISLRRLGLSDYFEAVETGSVDGCFKSYSMRKVLEKWGIPASEAAYVGDAPADVDEAREAGVFPISAAWADTTDIDGINARRPDATFHSVEEMMRWMNNVDASTADLEDGNGG